MTATRTTRTIAVNDACRLATRADMMYAADHRWWWHHDWCQWFKGERWTQNRGPQGWVDEASSKGLEIVNCNHSLELSRDQSAVSSGWNSAFQALNLAVLQGASRILLLGLDLRDDHGAHFFGDHPPGLQKRSPYATFIKAFMSAAPVLAEMGVEVINCSQTSALHCYPKMSVEDAISKRTIA